MEPVFPENCEVVSTNPPVQNLAPSSSPVTTVPILSNLATTATSIKPWLKVIFNDTVDIPPMISTLNVSYGNCGKIGPRQCVVFFGNAEELMEVKRRFEVVFEMAKEFEGFERELAFKIGSTETNSLLLE